jgi:hypothetical protein
MSITGQMVNWPLFWRFVVWSAAGAVTVVLAVVVGTVLVRAVRKRPPK